MMDQSTPSDAAEIRLGSTSQGAWLDAALANPTALLDDHCQCELKAASNALAMVGRHPQHDSLVHALSSLAHEELRHYRLVRDELRRRGQTPSLPLRSPYLAGLAEHRIPGSERLLDELLIATIVEARSCERFELLAESFHVSDPALSELYESLIRSERGHAGLFVHLAEEFFPASQVREELERRLALEAPLLAGLPTTPRMHGGQAG